MKTMVKQESDMKISIRLEKLPTFSPMDSRTNVYIWKGLDDLKKFYADSVNPRDIDYIAIKILRKKSFDSNVSFHKREGLCDMLNESCLCNLVEMQLLDDADALDAFMKKSVVTFNH